MNDFADFAEAAGKARSSAPLATVPDYTRIAVLGGGPDARLLAALGLAEGCEVTLFSAYGSELGALRASSGVQLRVAGPVGSYQTDREGTPSIRTTAELDAAVQGAEVIFLTGPVHKQRTYAMVLADHLGDGQVLVLAPARSLGALEAAWMLRIGGCEADITIVEAQALPYWFREEGAVLHLGEAAPAAAATLPRGREQVLEGLRKLLPNLDARESVLESGFADGSAAVEFPALLMSGPALGSGAVPIPMGGQPLPENETFARLLGPEQRQLVARLVAERAEVAKAYGVREIPGAEAMIATHGGAVKGAGARPVPDSEASRRLLRDGVIGSLVPLHSAAELAGIDTPVTCAMITLASAVLGAEVARAGRRLDTIGVRERDVADARARMDAIATGGL